MNNIDLELYRIFKVVADNNNITKASEILFISQPAVTKQINNLESRLNKKLFDRTKNGTFLTEDGKKLYNEISEPIDKLTNASKIFDYNNRIELGVHINMPKYVYNDSIIDYYKEDSDSIINIHLLTVENMFNQLDNNKIDLAFSKEYSNKDKFNFIKLGEFTDALVVRSGSKYIGLSKEELKKEEVYTLKTFSRTYENLIEELNYNEEETINIKNVNFSGIMDLLSSRDIIAYLPKEYIKDYLDDNTLVILSESDKKETFGIYYNNNNNINKLIEIFKKNIHN